MKPKPLLSLSMFLRERDYLVNGPFSLNISTIGNRFDITKAA